MTLTAMRLLLRRTLLAGASFGLVSLDAACAVDETDAAVDDDLTGISPTAISDQTIGNCWAYATTQWIQRLHTRVGGRELDLSESYLSYWWSYRQLMFGVGLNSASALPDVDSNGKAEPFAFQQGNTFGGARVLLEDYGIIQQTHFANDAPTGSKNPLHARAISRIGAWLKTGGLKSLPQERAPRSLAIAQMLDTAWELPLATRSRLDGVFGKNRDRVIGSAPVDTFARFQILRPQDLSAAIYQPGADKPRSGILAELVIAGTATSYRMDWVSDGKPAFDRKYDLWLRDDGGPAAVRESQRRVQRVLHQGLAVWFSFGPNKNAILPGTNTFDRTAGSAAGGSAGAHAVLLYDYDATLADGTRLAAGVTISDRNLLSRALRPDTTFKFWRIQNSWGTNPWYAKLNLLSNGSYDLTEDYLTVPSPVRYTYSDGLPIERPYWYGAALPSNIEMK